MGRDAQFDGLVRRHHRAVSTYARALTGDRTIAEDAVQETFLRAWRHLDTYRSDGSFEGWLLRICRNCVIDLARRDRRIPVVAGEPAEQVLPPDHSAELFALVDSLPLPQREVVVLCAVLGYDYESASAILGLPVGTVRSRLHRARAALGAMTAEAPTRPVGAHRGSGPPTGSG